MSTSTAYARVVRICAAGHDARTLRLALLDAIRDAVSFGAYAWVLTDPETWVGSAPLADVPALPELPRLIRLRYLTDVNRWTAGTPVARLLDATGGDPARSRLWREMLRAYDVVDMASSVFADRFGCWGFLDLWRVGGDPFSAADAAFLGRVNEVVTAALRRAQASTFVARTAPETHRLGPVVLLLSPDLEVLAQTPETLAYLQTLVPPDGDRPPVPASAYNVAAQLLAVEAGIDDRPPLARVHLADGRWLSLRASRIAENIAVTIEEAAPAERMSLFARACGLSSRETETVRHLTAGADTREIARRMFVSDNTVQDHFKSIFDKTDTRSRQALLARILGG
jgi:DNA-binding CsgD family transcriptional regulator